MNSKKSGRRDTPTLLFVIASPQITVLGSGTSAGVPTIGCDCETCTSDDPRDQRTRTCAAVEWIDPTGQHRLVLIDAGPDFRTQALRHNLRRCDALLVTHNHTDHIFGIDELRRFNAIMPGHPPIGVYAEPRCWVALRRVYQHVMEKSGNVNHSFVASLVAHEIDDIPYDGGSAIPIDLWGMRFTPVRVLHGKLPVLAFRVEAIDGVRGVRDDPSNRDAGRSAGRVLPAAWVTDASSIPTRSWRSLAGVRTLFIDGLRHRRHPTHFTLSQAQRAVARIEPDRAFLIHIAHEVLHARDEPGLVAPTRLAVDGLLVRQPPEGGVVVEVESAPGRREPYGPPAARVGDPAT